jgi:hypothetical protein
VSPGARAVCAGRSHALATGLLVLGVAGGVLSACSRGVEVSPPPHHPSCGAATALWPRNVSGRATTPVSASSGRASDAAAWGDPAIIATCGWPALAPTTRECLEVDGVDWVVDRLSDGVRFTTFGRDPAIEVLVPHAYSPEPLVLPAFSPAARALPTNGRTCR